MKMSTASCLARGSIICSEEHRPAENTALVRVQCEAGRGYFVALTPQPRACQRAVGKRP